MRSHCEVGFVNAMLMLVSSCSDEWVYRPECRRDRKKSHSNLKAHVGRGSSSRRLGRMFFPTSSSLPVGKRKNTSANYVQGKGRNEEASQENVLIPSPHHKKNIPKNK